MNIYFITTSDRTVFGVGQTTRSLAERHKDRDWTKVHGLLELQGDGIDFLRFWEDVDVVDHDIHRWLAKQPGIRRKNEWFTSKLPLDVIGDMIEAEFFTTSGEERTKLSLRPHQQSFVNKARAPYDEFLLAAKCRAGKSVMVLSHVVDRACKVTLVTSRFCSPFQSWHADTKNFDRFADLVAIELSDKNYREQIDYWMGTTKQLVLCSTVQGLVRKVDRLPAIDLLVFDEAHVGDKAAQFLSLRDKLPNTPVLKVSGTAYDQLWDSTEGTRFVYDYFQEQIDVQAGLLDRPRMEVVLARYESEAYSDIYDDDADAMNNLFLVEDGRFRDEHLVREFITKYFDNRSLRPRHRLLHGSKHMYMCLPTVAACHAFRELIDGVVPTMVVTGDSHKDAEDIDQFVREHTTSLCVTVSANVLGVTQTLWDTVINCRGGKSIQFWTQFAFRAGSGDHNWRVIDFVPTRALESLRETFCMANDLNPALSEYEFTDFVPIHEWNEAWSIMSTEDINRILSADIGSTVRLMTGGTEGLDVGRLNEWEFDTDAAGLFQTEVTKRVLVQNENNNNDTAKVRTNDTNPAQASDLQAKIRALKLLLSLLPQVILEEVNDGRPINTIDDAINCQNYNLVTGDTKLLRELLDDKVLDSRTLSRRVMMTRQSIETSLVTQPFSEVLMDLNVATGVSQPIPPAILDTMAGL